MRNEPVYVNKAAPFLKWAGGKRRLLTQYTPYFPPRKQVNRYFEPFVGGAAVFFKLQYTSAFLSDQNEKLIEAFRVVRDDVDALIVALKPHRNEADY